MCYRHHAVQSTGWSYISQRCLNDKCFMYRFRDSYENYEYAQAAPPPMARPAAAYSWKTVPRSTPAARPSRALLT